GGPAGLPGATGAVRLWHFTERRVGAAVDAGLEVLGGATASPARAPSRLRASTRHWTAEAPFHGACQRDLMAKDEPSRSFLHRWSSRTKDRKSTRLNSS